MADSTGSSNDHDHRGATVLIRSDAPRLPNKKKYDEDLELLAVGIREKEAELKSLTTHHADDKGQVEGGDLQSQRESLPGRRKVIDTDLRSLSHEITKQEHELTRIKCKLIFRDEARFNEKIERLNSELAKHNFSVSEERKLVAEIDSLKRSKKELTTFQAVKKQIDDKRDQQRKLRSERDMIFGEEKKLRERSKLAEIVKRDLTELRRRLRLLQVEFSAQEREYHQLKEDARRRQLAQNKRDKEDQRKAHQQAYQLEVAEYDASHVAYAEDKLLCATLIKYVTRFSASTGYIAVTSATTTTTDEAGIGGCSAVIEVSLDSTTELDRSYEAEGLFVLRRKASDEEDQMNRVRLKRKKKPSMNRKTLSHTPEIFAQFERLGLDPPANVADLPTCLEELESKKRYFDGLAAVSKITTVSRILNKDTRSNDEMSARYALLCAEEALPSSTSNKSFDNRSCEGTLSTASCTDSIPTTPDVSSMLDAAGPGLLSDTDVQEYVYGGGGDVGGCGEWVDHRPDARRRKISFDSGTGELEEQSGIFSDLLGCQETEDVQAMDKCRIEVEVRSDGAAGDEGCNAEMKSCEMAQISVTNFDILIPSGTVTLNLELPCHTRQSLMENGNIQSLVESVNVNQIESVNINQLVELVNIHQLVEKDSHSQTIAVSQTSDTELISSQLHASSSTMNSISTDDNVDPFSYVDRPHPPCKEVSQDSGIVLDVSPTASLVNSESSASVLSC